MLKEFEIYLEKKGYSSITPNGFPSTTADYPKRIAWVAYEEHLTIGGVILELNNLIKDYDVKGIKQEKGKKSHSAVINALKRFKEFIESINV